MRFLVIYKKLKFKILVYSQLKNKFYKNYSSQRIKQKKFLKKNELYPINKAR